jgi:hypothetical protein
MRKLGPLLVIIGLLINGAAWSDPLTFYFQPAPGFLSPGPNDEADWLAAVAQYQIAPYPYHVAETQTLTTIENRPNGTCCIVVGSTQVTSNVEFSSLFYDFAQSGQFGDSQCFGVPNCIVTGTSDQVIIRFPTPIYGLSANLGIVNEGPLGFYVNGQKITGDYFYSGFFGVTGGPISELDFQCYYRCAETDDRETLGLIDIVVATVDEPSAFASLAAGLVLLVAVSRRRRKGGKRLWTGLQTAVTAAKGYRI